MNAPVGPPDASKTPRYAGLATELLRPIAASPTATASAPTSPMS